MLYSILYTFVALVFAEYICLVFKQTYSPSYLINNITNYFKKLWFNVGRFIVNISKIYKLLQVEKIPVAFMNIIKSFTKLCISPIEIYHGYMFELNKEDSKKSIVAGTITWMFVLVYGVSTYGVSMYTDLTNP